MAFFKKYLCISWDLFSRFLIEPIMDLSRFNPCGIYLWLIFHLLKWSHPIPWTVPSNPLLVRITSSGIRASTLDTGSILSDIFFLSFVSLSHSLFVFCSIIWVMFFFFRLWFLYVHLPSLSLFDFVFHFCFVFCFHFLFSVYSIRFRFSFCALFHSNSVCWMNLGFGSNCIISYWTNTLAGPVELI